MANLFKGITNGDFFKINPKGQIIHKNRILTDKEKESIILQAKMLLSDKLLEVLFDEMENVASRKIYLESTSNNDIVAGKWTLWTIDVLKKKIENLANLK